MRRRNRPPGESVERGMGGGSGRGGGGEGQLNSLGKRPGYTLLPFALV